MNGVPKLRSVWSHPGNCKSNMIWGDDATTRDVTAYVLRPNGHELHRPRIDAALQPTSEANGSDVIAVQRGLAFGA